MGNLSFRISTTRSHNIVFFIDPSYTFDIIKMEDKKRIKKINNLILENNQGQM